MFFKRKELKHQFVTLLTLPDRNKDFPFFIDHMDLYKFDPLLAHTLSEHHTVCTMVMSEAIINIQKKHFNRLCLPNEKKSSFCIRCYTYLSLTLNEIISCFFKVCNNIEYISIFFYESVYAEDNRYIPASHLVNPTCGTRTHNLRIRSPTPCPIGQGGLTFN